MTPNSGAWLTVSVYVSVCAYKECSVLVLFMQLGN